MRNVQHSLKSAIALRNEFMRVELSNVPSETNVKNNKTKQGEAKSRVQLLFFQKRDLVFFEYIYILYVYIYIPFLNLAIVFSKASGGFFSPKIAPPGRKVSIFYIFNTNTYFFGVHPQVTAAAATATAEEFSHHHQPPSHHAQGYHIPFGSPLAPISSFCEASLL